MRKNRKIGLIAWLLGLALANVLLFSLNQGLTPTFWITFVFVWIAFISVIVVQTMVWKKATSPNEQFLRMPAITISFIYLVAQIPVSIVFALGSTAIPHGVTVIVNFILLVVAWLLVLGGLVGNDHIRKVNGRQKNHHIEL